MIRLLILLNGDNGGGIERFVANMLLRLRDNDEILCGVQLLRSEGGIYYEHYKEYANVFYSPILKNKDGLIVRWKKYYRLFNKFKPDCVLSFAYWDAAEQSIVSWITKVPFLVAYRNTIPVRKWTAILKAIPINSFSYACIANSHAVAHYLKHDLFINSNIIYNFLNGIVFDEFVCDRSLYKEIAKSQFTILTVARLEKVKNHQLIINIAKKAKNNNRKWQFIWAGDGSMKKFYEKIIEEEGLQNYVKMLGYVEDIKSLYMESDVFLLTSHNEGLSQALLEACASGLPAIVSDVPGMRDVIEHGVNGYVVKLSKLDEFFYYIDELEANEQSRQRMAIASMELVRERFSFEKVLHHYIDLIIRASS